ncbi:MAG: hypothetical protein EOO42_04310 [Flavobacteriales bacterium]|nr:MAG: hypothetical protein EOO42_04310 [Flavobacteriales bacterium]
MERNTLTTAGELNEGDRFYKVTGKKTEIYEHRGFKSNSSINAYPVYGKRFIEEIKKTTQVIYLRNIND